MISKELLNEVLKLKINLVEIDEARNKVFYYCNQFGRMTGEISTFELAHKCKEWAFKQGYELFSRILSNDNQPLGNCLVIRAESDPETVLIIKNANTEPESIFKACEWIMGRTK